MSLTASLVVLHDDFLVLVCHFHGCWALIPVAKCDTCRSATIACLAGAFERTQKNGADVLVDILVKVCVFGTQQWAGLWSGTL